MNGSAARYLVFNDDLPTNITDLDMDFLDIQSNNMSYNTKFYTISLGGTAAAYTVTATRRNSTNDFGLYTVYYDSSDGKIWCTSPGSKPCTKIVDAEEVSSS